MEMATSGRRVSAWKDLTSAEIRFVVNGPDADSPEKIALFVEEFKERFGGDIRISIDTMARLIREVDGPEEKKNKKKKRKEKSSQRRSVNCRRNQGPFVFLR